MFIIKCLVSVFLCFILLIPVQTGSASESNEVVIFLNDLKITSLMRAVSKNDLRAAKIFLNNGSSVNEKNIAGVSVVHLSVKNDYIDVLKFLIGIGADVNVFDNEKFTPLMRACINGNGEIVKTLIDSGANVWPENIFGETAMFLAALNDCNSCIRHITNKDFMHNGTENWLEYRNKEIDKALKVAYRKQNTNLENFLLSYKRKINRNGKDIRPNYILDAKRIDEKKFRQYLKGKYKNILK